MKRLLFISFFLFQSYLFSQVFEGITLLTNLGGAENIEHKTRLINNNFEEALGDLFITFFLNIHEKW